MHIDADRPDAGQVGVLPRPKRSRRRQGETRLAYTLIAPASLVLLAVIFYPLVSTIVGAFGGTSGPTLANFEDAITHDAFFPVVLQSLLWTFGVVALLTVVALALALALNEQFRGRGLARVALLLPWATPVAWP